MVIMDNSETDIKFHNEGDYFSYYYIRLIDISSNTQKKKRLKIGYNIIIILYLSITWILQKNDPLFKIRIMWFSISYTFDDNDNYHQQLQYLCCICIDGLNNWLD